MKNTSKFVYCLFAISLFFLFVSIFYKGGLTWGDAPHFVRAELQELLSEPLAWSTRDFDLGGYNQLLFLSPLMLIYGLFGSWGLSSDLITSLVFYIPGIVLGAVGPWILLKKLKYPKSVRIIASFVYVFNSYFLLLIDGGQVGVVLAYGLFPLTLSLALDWVYKPSDKTFLYSLISYFTLTMVDPRIAIILVFTVVLWVTLDSLVNKNLSLNNYRNVAWLVIINILLGAYWIFPQYNKLTSTNLHVGQGQSLSLLNPLLLYAPHWPENIFGRLRNPGLLFVIFPVLVIVQLIYFRCKNVLFFSLLFLIT